MANMITGLLYVGIFVLVGGGILMALGANVTEQVRTSLLTGETITNETIVIDGSTNNTAISLDTNTQVTSIVIISNLTTTIPSNFYTLSSNEDGATVTPVLPNNYTVALPNWNVTYSQLHKTQGALSAANATTGVGQFSAQLPLVGIVIGITAVILILFSYLFPSLTQKFGRGRE